jgi:hypothetical protein
MKLWLPLLLLSFNLTAQGVKPPAAASKAPVATSVIPQPAQRNGAATYCRRIPPFVNALGFSSNALLSTSDKIRKGLLLIELPKGDTPPKEYQHPSWSKAGWLAPISLDEKGNVYLGPVPVVNTLFNPASEQNTLYRVDSVDQELRPFLTLNTTAKVNEQNAFGILGIALNCNDRSLYVSSVFGSTRQQALGQIVRINPETKAQTVVLANTDAMGLALYRYPTETRLFYGLAREPEIWSVGLTDAGAAKSDARLEINLEQLGLRGDDRARRINFQPNGDVLVWGVDFSFNLIAPTEKLETIYRFARNNEKNSWQYAGIERMGQNGQITETRAR